jgi:glycosyltransferase involved in cell wall biosynthesis
VFPGLLTYKRELARYLAARRADVVHANGVKAHVLAAWARSGSARVVWHVHDYLSPRRVSSGLLRILKTRVSGVIANSGSVADDVRAALGAGLPVHVVPNGIDANRFTTVGPRLDLDAAAGLPAASAGTVRVGLVATYAKWKGHETFLRAMAALDHAAPVRGFIIGGPVYATGGSQWSRAELERRVAELGLGERVGLIDFQTDTAAVYRALDVVVHASTEPEPFGLVIAEAMTCGRAVVVSGAGGAREIGQPGRSLMTHTPGDAADLARVIGMLAGDATLRACLGATAAAHARAELSLGLMGERVDAVYAQVLS